MVQLYLLSVKMDCYYHPKQPLTNFCSHPQCSLPLCPKCISLHLAQSNVSHQLQPLNQAYSSTVQQLQIAHRGLDQQLQSLRKQYQPQMVMKDYHQMLIKYREQAISEINRHYDYLEREVLTEISNRYAHHLQNLIPPIQNLYGDFQKHLQNIKKNDKSIETMIVINSTQCILDVQELLLKIKSKKADFKAQLPRLQDGEAGKLRMAGQRLQLYSQRQSINRATPLPLLNTIPALSGIDKIAQLEARLYSLRNQ